MTSQAIKKSNTVKKSIRLMCILAAVFVVLLAGYFIISPMLEDEEAVAEAVVYDPIWESEVASTNGRVLMYPHYERTSIKMISIHNPDNAVYGQQYVDWGFYQYDGPEENENDLIPGDFYLINYEYAPYDSTMLSNVVVGAGFALSTSRVEDHCDDYSRYGLDFADPEDAISVTMETTDGKTYTYYVGDKTPSGSGYYVRVAGEDKLLSTGETMERDSVYTLSPNNLEAAILSSPVELVTPTLTLPVDTQTAGLFEAFYIWRHEDEYIYEHENEDGTVSQKYSPAISVKPLNQSKDPFAQYAGLSVYYAASHPGYYISTRFETLSSLFADFKGTEVMELASLITDAEGESYYGFDDATREKYGLGADQIKYTVRLVSQGIENDVYFSELQEESYYYAYSLVFNTICKVTVADAYFLQWEDQAFLMNQLVYLGIDKCDSIKISGSYYALGVDENGRTGLQEINETYQLTGTGNNLVVNTADGVTLDTAEFRELYQILISIANRGKVSDEEAAEAMKNAPVATIEVSSRRSVVYKTDSNGNSTNEEDYVLESVSKKFRFYQLSDGRLFCTIEEINADGTSSGETGSFYVLSSRLEQLFVATQDLRDGLSINEKDRY
ncbi:MAG: DUF4340 domain-containing protein [Clostridia bacterium]|nr:DUF4340 domain-containing protein [Clostridia bacterium]